MAKKKLLRVFITIEKKMVLLNALLMIFLGHKLHLATSAKDLDITLMYAIIRNTYCCATPNNGWGRPPNGNNIIFSDDIERIRHYFQIVHWSNVLEMDTTVFNTYALDLIQVIVLVI